MFSYPMKVELTDGSYFLSFPDIPEALSQSSSIDEALVMGKDALETALEFYFEEGNIIPSPSIVIINEPTTGKVILNITISKNLWKKIVLHNVKCTFNKLCLGYKCDLFGKDIKLIRQIINKTKH